MKARPTAAIALLISELAGAGEKSINKIETLSILEKFMKLGRAKIGPSQHVLVSSAKTIVAFQKPDNFPPGKASTFISDETATTIYRLPELIFTAIENVPKGLLQQLILEAPYNSHLTFTTTVDRQTLVLKKSYQHGTVSQADNGRGLPFVRLYQMIVDAETESSIILLNDTYLQDQQYMSFPLGDRLLDAPHVIVALPYTNGRSAGHADRIVKLLQLGKIGNEEFHLQEYVNSQNDCRWAIVTIIR